MKSFFDVNVLLEMLLEGRLGLSVALAAVSEADSASISPLVAHLYVHFGLKEKHQLKPLTSDLQEYQMLDMNQATVDWAIQNSQNNDFEDALQVGSAILGGCRQFVTFDVDLARNYGKFIKVKLLRADQHNQTNPNTQAAA